MCVEVCIEKAFYWLYLLHVLNFHKNPVLCECVYERGGERIKYMHSFTWSYALWVFIFITGFLCTNIYTVCNSIRLPLSQCWFYHNTVVNSRWSQWECLVFIYLFCLILFLFLYFFSFCTTILIINALCSENHNGFWFQVQSLD